MSMETYSEISNLPKQSDAHKDEASIFKIVPYTKPDPIFDLTVQYLNDEFPNKVNLGQGTYRDARGQPWVLPAVKAAKKHLEHSNHEYLPILGLKEFRESVPGLILGESSRALNGSRVAVCQTLSGTGALHLFGNFFKSHVNSQARFYITEPTWTPHRQVFEHLGIQVRSFDYLDRHQKKLDFENFLQTLEEAPYGSVFVLHACAHNPSGCDPTREQWQQIGAIMKRRNLFPLFDAAYLGMVSGSLDQDSYAIRHFVDDLNLESAVCVSFAKIMGLYGERCGALLVMSRESQYKTNIESQMEQLQRREISNPPAFGARIVARVLSEPSLTREWRKNLEEMSARIAKMRHLLQDELERLRTPRNWNHVTQQGGMFCILGLDLKQVNALKDKYHVYMAASSRISVAGINEENVQYIAKSVTAVLRQSQTQLQSW